ncbi:hypothetical protein MA16_Dca006761 [Dendrobium catenatum]|uniref:Uncharacterized protein n=1 Tax=Dendrobium catenatum TaxID=906689 RepID=A0A2I0W936_9ASPA|nr:hypothetical protein MA16_Dca006761 [Dendrobium catenatum]
MVEDRLKKLLEAKPNPAKSEAKETIGGHGRGGNPNPFRGSENSVVEILEGEDEMPPLELFSREERSVGKQRGVDFARGREELQEKRAKGCVSDVTTGIRWGTGVRTELFRFLPFVMKKEWRRMSSFHLTDKVDFWEGSIVRPVRPDQLARTEADISASKITVFQLFSIGIMEISRCFSSLDRIYLKSSSVSYQYHCHHGLLASILIHMISDGAPSRVFALNDPLDAENMDDSLSFCCLCFWHF